MEQDLLGLAGRTVLVTGAGQGGGRGIALAFARAGAAVAVCDLEGERAEAVAAEVRALGVSALALTADVRDETAVAGMIDAATASLGIVDVLVNNVGNYGAHAPGPVTEIGWDFWQTAIDLNLRSTFLCSQAFARVHPGPDREGAIVNVASLSGVRASPGKAPYGAAKAAVIHLTKTLALELAPRRIRVNCVAPTGIEGPSLTAAASKSSIEAMRASIPLGALCSPESLGDCVLMLASRLARFVTGEVVMCDGGASLTTARAGIPLGEGHRPELRH
ncbi:MAG: SDR family oxidoreductase [Myxococcales bacterium]|nr:SDR family oxidoreductase [Myxococcales bacterium]